MNSLGMTGAFFQTFGARVLMTMKQIIRLFTLLSLFVASATFVLPNTLDAGEMTSLTSPESSDNSLAEQPVSPSSTEVDGPERFEVVFDGAAVHDRLTGLYWEQSPDPALMGWSDAVKHCENLEISNKKGWRLATVDELTSLVDPSVLGSPKLPDEHPFDTGCKFGGCVQADTYWTKTPIAENSSLMWAVCFCDGSMKQADNSYDNFAWCTLGEDTR